jgi:hypothetical protein
MIPDDIFRIEANGVLWRDAVTTVETAKDRIEKLADSSPGTYLILNQTLGQRILVTPGFVEKTKYLGVKSGHHAPRIGMG